MKGDSWGWSHDSIICCGCCLSSVLHPSSHTTGIDTLLSPLPRLFSSFFVPCHHFYPGATLFVRLSVELTTFSHVYKVSIPQWLKKSHPRAPTTLCPNMLCPKSVVLAIYANGTNSSLTNVHWRPRQFGRGARVSDSFRVGSAGVDEHRSVKP